jgi:hypothetical protein
MNEVVYDVLQNIQVTAKQQAIPKTFGISKKFVNLAD